MSYGTIPIEVLLVEDSETDAMMTLVTLKDGKITINLHRVETGEQGLAFLLKIGEFENEPTPDLMLLDRPGISGQEVLEQIKNDEKLKIIPVVVLTTSRAEEDIEKAYEMNANCYITKPVGFDELSHVMRLIEQFWFGIVALPEHG